MSAKTTGEEEHENSSTPSNTTSRFQNDINTDKEELFNLISQLQLPRMYPNKAPVLRILAVADIDLTSAAALAEHALSHTDELGGGNVDCIIACGPFVRDEDLRQGYLQGRYRKHKRESHERSREETAALEGLVSAAISQLESIVCRVVFVPHPTDPLTTLYESNESSNHHVRLTSNSINIHNHWLSLAPGIGCCGYAGISGNQRQLLHSPDGTRVRHGYVQ